jgi:hypothetical protein
VPIRLLGAALLSPSAATACTWCVSSAFGDRTFNWAYLGLLLAPFVVTAIIAGVLMYHYRPPRGTTAARRAAFHLAGGPPRDAEVRGGPVAVPHPLEKETT